ncbi:hypothetical protein [Plantactinospora sp. WMMB782]|uniref:hypothetical protein n=1 Tax=Plantactinospora sp. WMMB782 TaxID=3404121 RepID=UPI003B956377
MTDLEEHITIALRDHAEGEIDAELLLARATTRGRARRARHGAVLAASLLALAGFGTVVGISDPRTPPAPSEAATSTGSPEMRLAAAAMASETTSYEYSMTCALAARPGATVTDGERSILNSSRFRMDVTGAFDPATVTGYLRMRKSNLDYEQRLVRGARFTRLQRPGLKPGENNWSKPVNGQQGFEFGSSIPNLPSAVADPAGLLKLLRTRGSVSEPKAGEYHFTISPPHAGNFEHTGDVLIGADGRVAQVTIYPNKFMNYDGITNLCTLKLSNYGTTVTVERPPNG